MLEFLRTAKRAVGPALAIKRSAIPNVSQRWGEHCEAAHRCVHCRHLNTGLHCETGGLEPLVASSKAFASSGSTDFAGMQEAATRTSQTGKLARLELIASGSRDSLGSAVVSRMAR